MDRQPLPQIRPVTEKESDQKLQLKRQHGAFAVTPTDSEPYSPASLRKPPPIEDRSPDWPARHRYLYYFNQEVAGDSFLEFQLLLVTLTTGCLDVVTYITYGVFTSKQTCNTLLLALHTLQPSDPAAETSYGTRDGTSASLGVSLGAFIAGAIVFGHMGNLAKQRLRGWLMLSALLQAALSAAAVGIRVSAPGTSVTGATGLGTIALLAVAEGAQLATALNVGMADLNTFMITGAIVQLCSDWKVLKLRNPARDRRVRFVVSMVAGFFIGSAALTSHGPSVVLIIVAALKGFLVLTFLFNRGVEKRASNSSPLRSTQPA